jgi:hypothetical protein
MSGVCPLHYGLQSPSKPVGSRTPDKIFPDLEEDETYADAVDISTTKAEDREFRRIERLRNYIDINRFVYSTQVMSKLAQAAEIEKVRAGTVKSMVLARMRPDSVIMRGQEKRKLPARSPRRQHRRPVRLRKDIPVAGTVHPPLTAVRSPYQALDKTSQQIRLLQL